MKFLLDMGLAGSTARYLRDCGHDAVHLREQGLLDELIARFAADLDRGALIRVL
jgi:predicted nuclease of predicted toxin-antitoxin system